VPKTNYDSKVSTNSSLDGSMDVDTDQNNPNQIIGISYKGSPCIPIPPAKQWGKLPAVEFQYTDAARNSYDFRGAQTARKIAGTCRGPVAGGASRGKGPAEGDNWTATGGQGEAAAYR
jgi:hypothetical protein